MSRAVGKTCNFVITEVKVGKLVEGFRIEDIRSLGKAVMRCREGFKLLDSAEIAVRCRLNRLDLVVVEDNLGKIDFTSERMHLLNLAICTFQIAKFGHF